MVVAADDDVVDDEHGCAAKPASSTEPSVRLLTRHLLQAGWRGMSHPEMGSLYNSSMTAFSDKTIRAFFSQNSTRSLPFGVLECISDWSSSASVIPSVRPFLRQLATVRSTSLRSPSHASTVSGNSE